jgi:hypothetical protein
MKNSSTIAALDNEGGSSAIATIETTTICSARAPTVAI